MTVNFSAAITVSGLPTDETHPGITHQIQYTWLNSSGASAPAQSVELPHSQAGGTVTVTGSRTVGAGVYWVSLQAMLPNYSTTKSSPRVNFTVTCPTPGTLKTADASKS
jgi:hypothetical protein